MLVAVVLTHLIPAGKFHRHERQVIPGSYYLAPKATAGQLCQNVELGCQGPNHTKAVGRCGMGLCQGSFCRLTVTEVIAQARRVESCDVGYYRIRPPIKLVMLGDFVR
jgi:hypothetical protein